MLRRLENHNIDPRRVSTIHSRTTLPSLWMAKFLRLNGDSLFCCFVFLVNLFTIYLIDIIAECSPLADRVPAHNCRRMCKMQAVRVARQTIYPNPSSLVTNAKIRRKFSLYAQRFFHHNMNAPYSIDQMVLSKWKNVKFKQTFKKVDKFCLTFDA